MFTRSRETKCSNVRLLVKDFGDLSSESGTQDRALAFLSLSNEKRTFHNKIPKSEETVASSNNMSGASKSTTRSSSKFALDDIDSQFAKKKSLKETSSVPPVPKPATRSKSVATKRKRSLDPKEELGAVKRNMMSSLTDGISFIEEFYEKNVADLEEELNTLRSSLAAKDAELGMMVKEKKIVEDSLERSIKANDKKWRKEVENAVHEAKVCASKAVLESRVKIVKQALDPDFDKTSWDLEHWEQLLKEMVDDDEEDIGTAEKLVEMMTKGKDKLVDEPEVVGEDQGVGGNAEVGEGQGNAP